MLPRSSRRLASRRVLQKAAASPRPAPALRTAAVSGSPAAAAASAGAPLGRAQPTDGFVGTIGWTPLIRLDSVSRELGRNVFAKAEFLNPGGSVKDRAALGIVEDAERRGFLNPENPSESTVVEGTAGNTGIGLAHICLARGYKCVIFMPDTQSQGKMDALRQLGAQVHAVPAVAFEHPDNYNHQAKRFAESVPGAYWTNQFDNVQNQEFHYLTTGPEIVAQTPRGKVDGFVCATGTGGTLAGVGRFLKEASASPDCQLWLADPPGSVLFEYFQSGRLNVREGSSVTEGIGQGRCTENLQQVEKLIDQSVRVTDEESIAMTFRLLGDEGFPVGVSSGLNVAAAVKLAQTLPKGANVVTVLCDGMRNYAGRVMNREWIESKGLYEAVPEEYRRFLE